MELVKNASPTVVDLQPLVSDQLLNQIHGDILLIHSNQITHICNRSAANMRQQAISWLNMAADTKGASFIAGHVSDKGGRFQIITRDQAINLISLWVFEEIQHGMD